MEGPLEPPAPLIRMSTGEELPKAPLSSREIADSCPPKQLSSRARLNRQLALGRITNNTPVLRVETAASAILRERERQHIEHRNRKDRIIRNPSSPHDPHPRVTEALTAFSLATVPAHKRRHSLDLSEAYQAGSQAGEELDFAQTALEACEALRSHSQARGM